MSKKPVVLMVLDGYGLNDKTEGNAIAMAHTPVMDELMKTCPFVPRDAQKAKPIRANKNTKKV